MFSTFASGFGLPFLLAMFLVIVAGAPVIAYLRSKKSVQPISPDAPEKHRLKHGTPTMGGLLILAAVSIVTMAGIVLHLVTGGDVLTPEKRGSLRVLAVLIAFLAAGGIGILDDLGKARKKENKAGLSERAKLVLQFSVAIVFVAALYLTRDAISSRQTVFPLGNWTFDLGWFYYPLAVLFIVGFSNAVNFTDGLDGLASGTTLIVSSTLAMAAQDVFQEIRLYYGAVAGACSGFLWYNAYPARVFMGDTGSLALGVGIACASLAAKQETLFFVIGIIYLAEIGSMMIQRYVFKYRRIRFGIEYAKANRVFRRAPLHHHFEELGLHEVQVVVRFWMVGLIAAAIGLLLAGSLAIPNTQLAENVRSIRV